MSYKPKIEVVVEVGHGLWGDIGSTHRDDARAILVRGVPVPGERVMDRDGTVHTVRNLEVKWVEMEDGSHRLIKVLRPYDPEAERLRVATEAVKTRAGQWWVLTTTEAEVIARAVLDALKEVGDEG